MLISLAFIAHMPFRGRGIVGGMGCVARAIETARAGACSTRHSAGGALFDHLIGLGKHQNWDLKAEGVSGLEIDH
jgi:hypothetical protein